MPPFLSHNPQTSPSSSSLLHHLPSLRSLVPSIRYQTTSHFSSIPTKTKRSLQPLVRSVASVFRRQQQQQPVVNPSVLPTTYTGINDGPPPGTVAGIVLGSVCGFVLLLWLIYSCFYMNSGEVYEEEVVRRSSRSARRSSRSRSEMTQQRSSPRQQTRRETVIVEERRGPPVDREDDIVEVIEEHSRSRTPPRRERRSSDRRETDGYYRPVDPLAYGGGNAPPRKVSHR